MVATSRRTIPVRRKKGKSRSRGRMTWTSIETMMFVYQFLGPGCSLSQNLDIKQHKKPERPIYG